MVKIPVVADKKYREPPLPMVEVVIGLGLFIHDCLVEVPDGRKNLHRFRLYFTRHVHQPMNVSVLDLEPNLRWQGQILAMKVGKRNPNTYVNCRCAKDRSMADQAVLR